MSLPELDLVCLRGEHMSEISHFRAASTLRFTNLVPTLLEARALLNITEILLEPRELLTRQSIP